MNQIVAGALAGLLISLPDAFALHSYIGVLGTGLVFGGMGGEEMGEMTLPGQHRR